MPTYDPKLPPGPNNLKPHIEGFCPIHQNRPLTFRHEPGDFTNSGCDYCEASARKTAMGLKAPGVTPISEDRIKTHNDNLNNVPAVPTPEEVLKAKEVLAAAGATLSANEAADLNLKKYAVPPVPEVHEAISYPGDPGYSATRVPGSEQEFLVKFRAEHPADARTDIELLNAYYLPTAPLAVPNVEQSREFEPPTGVGGI